MTPESFEVREGGIIPIGTGKAAGRVRRRLLNATKDLPFEALAESRGVLRAGSAVGVIDIGETQVTILPKATGGRPPAEFMADLLWATETLGRIAPLAGRVEVVGDGLPDVLVKAIAQDLLSRLQQAVPRRYSERQSESSVLRGRIDFGRTATRPPAQEHVLSIRHAPLQADNPLTRVLRATARALVRFAKTPQTRSLLARCDDFLGAATTVPLNAEDVRRLRLNSFERQWSGIVTVAQALTAGGAPSPVRAGQAKGLTLLFSLNDLFESLLRRMLPRALEGSGLRVIPAPARPKLLRDPRSGAEFLSLKPDYVIADSVEPRAVADAKWKPLTASKPAHGLRSADVYQLGTYMARHRATRGVLFFPRQDWMQRRWRMRAELIGAGEAQIRAVAVDVGGLVSREKGEVALALKVLRQATVASVCSQAMKGTS